MLREHLSYIKTFYLLHPQKGGVAQPTPMNQVTATAPSAWLCPNLKVPKGLQMTTYLSKAKTARDHPVTSPVRKTSAFVHAIDRCRITRLQHLGLTCN